VKLALQYTPPPNRQAPENTDSAVSSLPTLRPLYVAYVGKRVFTVEAARALLRQLEEGQAEIRARARFSNPKAKEAVFGLYELAEKDLKRRINQRGG
jgi:hypothetical protein